MFRKKDVQNNHREPRPDEDRILLQVAYGLHNGPWFDANGITYDIIYAVMARKILALQATLDEINGGTP